MPSMPSIPSTPTETNKQKDSLPRSPTAQAEWCQHFPLWKMWCLAHSVYVVYVCVCESLICLCCVSVCARVCLVWVYVMLDCQ